MAFLKQLTEKYKAIKENGINESEEDDSDSDDISASGSKTK